MAVTSCQLCFGCLQLFQGRWSSQLDLTPCNNVKCTYFKFGTYIYVIVFAFIVTKMHCDPFLVSHCKDIALWPNKISLLHYHQTWLSDVIKSPRLLYDENETDIESSGPAIATCSTNSFVKALSCYLQKNLAHWNALGCFRDCLVDEKLWCFQTWSGSSTSTRLLDHLNELCVSFLALWLFFFWLWLL